MIQLGDNSAHALPYQQEEAAGAGIWKTFLAAWRTENAGPVSGSLWSSVVLTLVLGLIYFGLGQIAFSLEVRDFNITSQVFFPEGAALAFVIVFGPRVALGIFLGQFVLAHLSGLPILASGMTAVVNMLAGVLGGYLFWRWRISPHLNRPREVILLVVLCALVLQPISATGGILAHFFFNGLPAELIPGSWANWWIANVLGQMLLVPLVLSWLSHPLDAHDRTEIRRNLLVACLYFIPMALLVFGEWGSVEALWRVLLLSAFYLPLIGIASRSSIPTVSLFVFLLTLPVILYVHTESGGSAFFSEPVRYFCANLIMFAALVTALLLSSLREEVMLRNRQLHEAVAAREQLFAVIGHDLRGPIGTLKAFLDLMISGELSKEEFQEVQHDLRKGVNEANEALEGLLEWGAAMVPKFRSVELHKCAFEAIELLSLTAARKQIVIENHLPHHAWVEGDGHQLGSVFRNLLSNAVKFTRPGGRITFSASQENRFWSIAVSDTGIGMSQERADRLFRSSNEYHSTPGTANERGLGLGLQLCHEFVQANRGTISVTSNSPNGTTFYIKLPLLEAPGAETSAGRTAIAEKEETII